MRRLALFGLLALALSACSQETTSADPAPPTTSATAVEAAVFVIPDDFPLSDGMASEAYDDITVSAQSVGMRALDFCGRKPLRGLDPTDRLVAEASGPEYAGTRDLMVFADAGPPTALVADIRAAATACPAERLGPVSRLLTEVHDSSVASAAVTVVHTYETDGEVGVGAEIIEVVQVGRALLVTSTYSEWDPGLNLDEAITEEAARLEETVDAMSAFRNEPESPTVPES